MTVSDFTNKALQKVADLGYKIVQDLEQANDYTPEVRLGIDLLNFVENLNDPLCDWTDHYKSKIIEYYIERANLNNYAVVSWYGYYYNISSGGTGGGTAGADGLGISSAYIDNGDLIIVYTDGSEQNAGPVGVGANIFVTDVQPVNSGKSVELVYKSNTVGQSVVESVSTDDTELNIYILWDGGKEWNGQMVANNLTEFPNTARVSILSRMFTANVVVDVTDLSFVTISGNEGSTVLPINELAPVPSVVDIQFGAFPTTRGILQTELKDNDSIQLIITLSDSSNVSSIIVENTGSDAFLAGEVAVTNIGNNQVQAYVTADHNYLTGTSKGIKFRVKTTTGSIGDLYDSTGTEEVLMNNSVPVITFNGVTYPATQSALKDSETADVSITVSGHDEIEYQNTIGQLSIPSPTTYSLVKTVTRIDGQYNISLVNYTVVAYRNANGSQSSLGKIIQIAHAAAVITVVTPAARLISGGNDGTAAQDHIINVTSDQKLASNPDLSANIATLQNDMSANAGMTSFNETLRVLDTDTKGSGTFTISATNLSGKVTSSIQSGSAYVLGGFALRRKYFAAFTDEVQMGVDVVDTSKLNAWDKDLQPMTYVADQNDSVREYTIVNDDTIHWNDLAEVENNTTGLSFIEIEEVA